MAKYTFDDDYPLVPEGERRLRVVSKEDTMTKDGTRHMVAFNLEDTETGLTMRHQCMNESDPQAGGRWMLKNTFSAILGRKLPKGDIDIKDEEIIGRVFRATVKHNSYQGKTYANIIKLVMPEEVSPGQTEIGGGVKRYPLNPPKEKAQEVELPDDFPL